jgi:hypothetical protein
MGRRFSTARSTFLETTATPFVSAPPFSWAMWLYPYALSGAVMYSGAPGAADQSRHVLNIGSLQSINSNASAVGTAAPANATIAYAWNHYVGIWAATNSRTMIINGDIANKGTNTTSVTPTAANRLALGMRRTTTGGGAGSFFDGVIGMASVWNVALTDADAVTLALGASPFSLSTRPVAHFPLGGRHSVEFETVGNAGTRIGLDNTLTVWGPDAPSIVIPKPRIWDVPAAAAAAGYPWHYYAAQMSA